MLKIKSVLRKSVLRQIAVIMIVGLSVLSKGMALVWTSPVLVKLRDENQTVLSRPITEKEGSWLASATSLGCICAVLVSGYLLDNIGRKYCVIIACIPRLIMCFLYIFASEVWMLLLGRALCGITDGLSFTSGTTYSTEIASKEIRGAMGTINQTMLTVGVLIMLSTGPFISYLSLNVMMTCVTVIFTIPLFFLPETPYYLYTKGRTEESIRVLTFLRGSEELAHKEMEGYKAGIDITVDKRKLLKDKIFLKSMGIVLFLSVAMQLTGSAAVTLYLQTIFEITQTSLSSEISSVIIGCIQVFACLCTIVLTDRFGRKPVLAVNLFGMAIGMIGLGSFFKATEGHVDITGFMNYLPLISIMIILYCHNTGMAPLFWVLLAEILDGPVRAIGVSVGTLVTSVFVFLVTNYFSPVTNAIGPAATYWIFSFNCMITCLFILIIVPETKGKTFAEIQQALGRKDQVDKRYDVKI